jgi:hypothetical protein
MPIKRKATAKKVGKKAAAASPERDTKAVRTPPAATKAKARWGEEAGPAPARPGRRQGPEVTHEKALLRDDFGKEDGPAREREQPEELICGAAADDLAEELGEEFVRSATSGEQAAQDIRDEEVPEESGGPFVETSGRSEFAYGTDAGFGAPHRLGMTAEVLLTRPSASSTSKPVNGRSSFRPPTAAASHR